MCVDATHIFAEQSLDQLELMHNVLSSEAKALDNDFPNVIADIKAGAITLGLLPTIELATDLEGILEEIQLHQRQLTPLIRTTLLSAITVLKDNLSDSEYKDKVFESSSGDFEQATPIFTNRENKQNEAVPAGLVIWDIDFNPALTFLQTGGEPTQIFQALAILGDLTVELDETELPLFSELEPEQCYLAWHLSLTTYASQQNIEAIFNQHQAESYVTTTQRHAHDLAPSALSAKIDKLDKLQDLLTGLIQTQQTLHHLGNDFSPALWSKFDASLAQMTDQTQAIEDIIRHMRMWPAHHVYQHVQSSIFELSKTLNTNIELALSGGELDVDKAILEKLIDPVVALSNIAVKQGELTIQAGAQSNHKNAVLQLTTTLQGGQVRVEIAYDRGLKTSLNVTKQGDFDSTEAIERVKKTVVKLGGKLDVSMTSDLGVSFIVSWAQQQWVMQGQFVAVAEERYILPLSSVIASLEIDAQQLKEIADNQGLYPFEGEDIPVMQLATLLDISTVQPPSQSLLIIVNVEGRNVGLVVEDLLTQQRVVVNSLETHYRYVKGFSGAVIMGDESVVLVLDIAELIQHLTTDIEDKTKLNVAEAIS